jgi:hypothetical protein
VRRETILLLIMATLVTGLLIIAGLVVNDVTTTIEQQTQKLEPYGGCDEAYLYPDTAGARWCQLHGSQP